VEGFHTDAQEYQYGGMDWKDKMRNRRARPSGKANGPPEGGPCKAETEVSDER